MHVRNNTPPPPTKPKKKQPSKKKEKRQKQLFNFCDKLSSYNLERPADC